MQAHCVRSCSLSRLDQPGPPLRTSQAINAIPVSSALEYAAPVEIGDTITAIAEKEERTREGSLKVRLFFQNHRGELVAEGWALMGAES